MVGERDELIQVSDLERAHDTGKGVLRTILFDHEGERGYQFRVIGRSVIVTRATADRLLGRYRSRRHREFRGSPGKRPGRRPKTLADRGD